MRVSHRFPGRRAFRWIVVLIVLVSIGSIAYAPIMKYASDKVIEQVTDQLFTHEELETLTQDPSFQKIIDQLEDNHPVPAQSEESPASDDGTKTSDNTDVVENSDPAQVDPTLVPEQLSFTSNEDALKFLLTKFKLTELKSLSDKAKGGLTQQEKSEIKSIVTDRLTKTEYDSLKILAAMEIQRRQGTVEQ